MRLFAISDDEPRDEETRSFTNRDEPPPICVSIGHIFCPISSAARPCEELFKNRETPFFGSLSNPQCWRYVASGACRHHLTPAAKFQRSQRPPGIDPVRIDQSNSNGRARPMNKTSRRSGLTKPRLGAHDCNPDDDGLPSVIRRTQLRAVTYRPILRRRATNTVRLGVSSEGGEFLLMQTHIENFNHLLHDFKCFLCFRICAQARKPAPTIRGLERGERPIHYVPDDFSNPCTSMGRHVTFNTR